MSVIDSFKGREPASIALQLGLTAKGKGQGLGPCPLCNATTRGSEDTRGPIGVNAKGWFCWACQAKGDAAALALAVICQIGVDAAGAEHWGRVEEWAKNSGLMSPASQHQPRPRQPQATSVASMVRQITGERGKKAPTEAPPPRDASLDPASEDGGDFRWDPALEDRACDALWGSTPAATAARDYLMGEPDAGLPRRRLDASSVKAFRLGLLVDAAGNFARFQNRYWLVIPLFDAAERLISYRFRSIPLLHCEACAERRAAGKKGCKDCSSYRLCAGRPLPLYGAQFLPSDTSCPVLITEGELDVVAMHSYGFTTGVVSGTGGATTFEEAWANQLEPYAHFVGLYDNDEAGNAGWEKVTKLMGIDRTSRATLPKKDAGDCLAHGVGRDKILRAVERAEPGIGVQIRKADEFIDAIEERVENPDVLRGVAPPLMSLLKAWGGIRPGLITVSGETGRGKTTFLTWLLYALSTIGYGTLMTAFEIETIGVVEKHLRIQMGDDFSKFSKDERSEALRGIAKLPIYTLDHYGDLPAAKMVEIIRYAVRRLGVRFVVIDHLDYILGDLSGKGANSADIIRAVCRALSTVGRQLGVTIFLVAHPHNTPTNKYGKKERVTMFDLQGSAAIRQYSEDVLIVDALRGQKHPMSTIYFDKVRSEYGNAGSEVPIYFDPLATSFADSWHDTPSGRRGASPVIPGT